MHSKNATCAESLLSWIRQQSPFLKQVALALSLMQNLKSRHHFLHAQDGCDTESYVKGWRHVG